MKQRERERGLNEAKSISPFLTYRVSVSYSLVHKVPDEHLQGLNMKSSSCIKREATCRTGEGVFS